MSKLETIKRDIANRMQKAFPDFPSDIQHSPIDHKTLWVCVYAVPTHRKHEVEDLIFDLRILSAKDQEVILLPMLYDPEETKKHHPHKLLCLIKD